MSWFTRNRILALAGIAGAAGAIVAGALWPSGPSMPSPVRPALAHLKQNSQTYLSRHAQPWLTCPVAASTCYRWKMQEAAGNITDDLSGTSAVLTANGTPVYSLHTPIPDSTGMNTRRAIGTTDGDTNYFAAASSTTADQTTNNFSVGFWMRYTGRASAGDGYVFSKRTPALNAGYGCSVALASGKLQCVIATGTGMAAGIVSDAVIPTDGTWHYYNINFDRASTINAIIDGIAQATTADISGKIGQTITSSQNLYLFRYANAGNFDSIMSLSELMIADGLTTLAEHTALYKAFKYPANGDIGASFTTLTRPQTTTAKYLLPPEAGFGVRLGTYGGSATNPQWPVAYAASRVDASTNPLGLGFPEHGTLTNVIGYPNEFNSWVIAGGAAVTANNVEAPDGSMTAESVDFAGVGGNVNKPVVGGGSIVAGESWCASIMAKKLAGDGQFLLYACSMAGCQGTFVATSEWQRLTHCAGIAGAAKKIYVGYPTDASTDIAISDAEYYANNLPSQAVCTACTGAVNCVCNPSYTTLSWSGKTTYMPNDLERGEMVVRGAYAPKVHTADTKRTLADLGPLGYLVEGIQPVALLRNAGGDAEAVIRGKPLTIDEEARDYWLSWDLRNGLTNTNPRRYASLSIAHDGDRRTYQAHGLSARDLDDTEPPTQRQVNANSITLGCDISSTGSPINCVDGLDVETTLWARPAQEIVAADTDLVLDEKLEGPDYLQGASIPDLCAYDFGVASANRWCWNGAGYSGSLYDQINGVALAPTGTPTYQVPSGLLVRGQGRQGVNFIAASTEYIYASAASTLDVTTGALTVSAVVSTRDTSGNLMRIVSKRTATNGYELWYNGVAAYECQVLGAVTRTATSAAVGTGTRQVDCVVSRSANTVAVFVDGIASGAPVDITGIGSLTNASNFTVGTYLPGPIAARCWNGQINEVRISNSARTPAEILANYKRTTQTGKYWEDDANTIAHYKMNERRIVNGVGLRDSSGNGNHLTVVNGTPDPQYRDMPWPAGSGVVKPGVLVDTTGEYFSGSTIAPDVANPFSMVAWVRSTGSTSTKDIVYKQGGNPYYRMHIDATDHVVCTFTDTVPATASATSVATTLSDEKWHLVACKLGYSAPNYTAYVSVDGGAFAAGTSISGTITGNAGAIRVGELANAADRVEISGLQIPKNYALTDADVATLYGTTNPKGDLTHARTSTGPKGACWDVANDPVDGVRVRCWGDNQVPHAYSASLIGQPGNERLGLYEPDSDTTLNLALRSEEHSSNPPWVINGGPAAIITADVAIAPDGTKTADKYEDNPGSAASPWVLQYDPTLAGKTVTYCTHISYLTGTQINLAIYDNIGGWAQAIVTPLLSVGRWVRVCMSKAIPGGATVIAYGIGQNTTQDSSFYWWGSSLTETAAWPGVYCPTTAASQTCNAFTQNLVASATLTTWDRSTGIIVSATLPDFNGGYGWRLYNGVNANGIVYWLPTGTQAEIYNSVGVTQQDVRLTNATPAVLTGGLFTWDATGVIYGARRAYGRNFTAAYAGPWDTWSVDTGANWVSTTDTNFTIGGNSSRVTGAQIWKR